MSRQLNNFYANNKRIAKNTIFLYFRMIITMVVGLYTSRIVLQQLGESDYGIYNVVGGFVTMLAFINSTMANGTQRFLSFEIGKGLSVRLQKVFSNAFTLHLIIAALIFLIAETIGFWFIDTQMNIPESRHTAAMYVYQFSIFTFIISVIQVPFMSALISHEKMNVYAYMSIYDVTVKLIVVLLLKISDYDKLIIYSGLICLAQISSAILYNFYTQNKFEECSMKISWDWPIAKEIAGFSVWTLIGAFGCTTNGQGVNILLNIFYGTVVNAARGIALQVNGIIVGFSRNFQVAATPQIIKLYSEGKIEEMTNLAIKTSKYSAFLLLLLMLPVFINVEYMLSLWLGNYPNYTPTFVRIVLIQSLIQSMSGPVVTVTHAGGKLKMPNLTGGISIVLALPICYIALKLGCSPTGIFIINIFPWFFECFFDAYYAQKYAGFSLKRFYKEVYIKVFVVTFISIILSYCISKIIIGGLIGMIIDCSVCVIFTAIIIIFLGLTINERLLLTNIIRVKIKDINYEKFTRNNANGR